MLTRPPVFIPPKSTRRERGATLVEFAAILLPLLILFYGIIVYSLVFVTQQAVAFASERGADAAASVRPDMELTEFEALVQGQASRRVNGLLGFLPGGADSVSATAFAPTGANPSRRVEVTVSYAFGNWGLPTPDFLPMPNIIRAVGVANVSVPGT